MFSVICVWINGWVNNREAGDLRRNRGHYDVIVMIFHITGSVRESMMHSPHKVSLMFYLMTAQAVKDRIDLSVILTPWFSCDVAVVYMWSNNEMIYRSLLDPNFYSSYFKFYHHKGPVMRESFPWHVSSCEGLLNIGVGNICVTGPLCEDFTGLRWIPFTKASDAELWCFLWSAPE